MSTSATEIVIRFVDALNTLSIPYMLVGSFSSNIYGRPRSTKDADFVLQLSDPQLASLQAAVGEAFRFDNQLSFETVTATMRYVVFHKTSPFKVKLFLLSGDAHDQSRFARRQIRDIEGMPVFFPQVEDVVVTKLRWSRGQNRGKDVEDVRAVLKQQQNLDLAYIRRWTDQHGTRELFETLWAECSGR